MRPCAEGARAPRWPPLCSCCCCHCSCAVSGQSRNARFLRLLLTFHSYLALDLTVWSFVFLTPVFWSPHFVPLLHVSVHFPPPHHLPLSCIIPASDFTSSSLSVSHQRFPPSHLTLNSEPCSLYPSPSIIITELLVSPATSDGSRLHPEQISYLVFASRFSYV